MNAETSYAEFEASALAEGFDAVLVREWAPGQVVPEHTHPFTAKALVVRGEMWLSVGGQTRHLVVGQGFELAKGEPHSERYGDQGATYWVARRH